MTNCTGVMEKALFAEKAAVFNAFPGNAIPAAI